MVGLRPSIPHFGPELWLVSDPVMDREEGHDDVINPPLFFPRLFFLPLKRSHYFFFKWMDERVSNLGGGKRKEKWEKKAKAKEQT
jgi:hypothetical protein